MIKNLLKMMLVLAVALTTACAGVDSGHQGVEVSWGGQTNENKVYPEGIHYGFHWIFDDMVEYNAREATMVLDNGFLDIDGIETPVQAVLNYRIMPNKANKIHKEIGSDFDSTKVAYLFKSALKTVIPQYKGLDLNSHKRDEAEAKLGTILSKDLPEIYVEFKRVNITDLSIPAAISKTIIEKQMQEQRNLLAEKKKLEETNLAAARVEKAKGDYQAAEYDSKTKNLLSSPKMLELYKAETDRKWAEKGVSPYGTNNVFGSGVSILKNK